MYKKIELLVRDDDNTIEDLLRFIQFYSHIGHSFEIICDRENTNNTFFIDGDGEDKLHILNLEEISEASYRHHYKRIIPKIHRKEHHLGEMQ